VVPAAIASPGGRIVPGCPPTAEALLYVINSLQGKIDLHCVAGAGG